MPLRYKKGASFAPGKAARPLSRRWVWVWTIVLVGFGIVAGLFDFPHVWNTTVVAISQKTPIHLKQWNPRPFRLGLDLLGGTELVYDADVSSVTDNDRSKSMDGVKDVIERRVNSLGVAEPVVQVVKSSGVYRVIVQLAGIKDVNTAIKSIGETPVLEFKEISGTDVEEADFQKKLTDAQAVVNTIKQRFVSQPRVSLFTLAKEVNLTVTDLDVIKKYDYGSTVVDEAKLWEWANTHKVGQRSTEPIETTTGWHFLEVTNSLTSADKEIEASHILICYKGATRCDRDTTKEEALKQIQDLKTKATTDNFADLARQNSTEAAATTSGGALGWFGPGQMVKSFADTAFALKVGQISAVVETEFGYHLIYKTGERPLKDYAAREILVQKPVEPVSNGGWTNTGLSGKHLVRAQVEFDPNTGAPTIGLTFNDEGKQLFGDLTARNIDKPIAIFLDGGVISAPTVKSEIRSGNAVITGTFTLADAKLLAQRLNAGALPVPIKLVSQQTVGATLGQDSLEKSLKAGLIGFLLVALFMVLYYRVSGLLAIISLAFYTAIVLACFKFIPVTMTLAGIAGFILSLGIAVDANVLTFARMKEELLAGRSLSNTIEEGFRRSWPSIRDGHITTIVSSLVLFWFSSSMIKGFALTLGLGVIISLFSAMVVTKTFLRLASAWRWKSWSWLFVPIFKKPQETIKK